MKTMNNKIKKTISSILIISILIPTFLFSRPKQAEAVGPVFDFLTELFTGTGAASSAVGAAAGTTSTLLKIKDTLREIAMQFLRAIARKMLAEMTKSTVNWINSGFHGQPLFVQNPQSFFDDIGKSEVKKLVDQIGYDRLRSPFGKQFALQAIDSYKRTSQQNAEYSLSRVVNDPALLDNYRNNFYVGGWDGFLINTQYPQNNPIGYHTIEASLLGEKIAGTEQNAVSKVKETLNQGMGFLSPQTCPSNPNYNNLTNAFNKPTFSFNPGPNDLPPRPDPNDPKYQTDIGKYGSPTLIVDYANWQHQYDVLKTAKQKAWAETNECPKGLVNTTPGSVAANSIMNALGTPMKQGELSAAMGNSLSSIFDTLLNHFLTQGLNSLASKVNPTDTPDTWNYNGVTLGSPTADKDSFSGPDQEIILDAFKKQVSGYTTITNEDGSIKDILIGDVGEGGEYTPGDLENTKTEIELLDNTDLSNPGVLQLLKLIPEQTQELDQCIPGPDKGWDSRLLSEKDRVGKKLSEETNSTDGEKVKAANDSLRELKFAVDSFKDWIDMKITSSLPGSVLYVDIIKDIDNFLQQAKESTDARRTKSEALMRLQIIERSLALITKQPDPADTNYKNEENRLVAIKKQYDAVKNNVSTSTSIEDTKNTLNTLKDKLSNMTKMETQCQEERADMGWSKDGGENATQNGITELAQFCSIPIVSGYNHGDIIRPDDSNGHGSLKYTFRNPHGNEFGDAGYEDLPMVNAREIYGDDTKKFDPVVVDIDCNIVFKAKLTNYKYAGDPTY